MTINRKAATVNEEGMQTDCPVHSCMYVSVEESKLSNCTGGLEVSR